MQLPRYYLPRPALQLDAATLAAYEGLWHQIERAPEPAELASGAQLGSSLASALEALTPLERTAFVLRHLEQYPLEEIAHALESNVNACKQAIFRAVRKLRAVLDPCAAPRMEAAE